MWGGKKPSLVTLGADADLLIFLWLDTMAPILDLEGMLELLPVLCRL